MEGAILLNIVRKVIIFALDAAPPQKKETVTLSLKASKIGIFEVEVNQVLVGQRISFVNCVKTHYFSPFSERLDFSF